MMMIIIFTDRSSHMDFYLVLYLSSQMCLLLLHMVLVDIVEIERWWHCSQDIEITQSMREQISVNVILIPLIQRLLRYEIYPSIYFAQATDSPLSSRTKMMTVMMMMMMTARKMMVMLANVVTGGWW